MQRPNADTTFRRASLPPGADGTEAEHYRGVELAPTTLESLVTWDVSGQARYEQDRLDSACRAQRRAIAGGY